MTLDFYWRDFFAALGMAIGIAFTFGLMLLAMLAPMLLFIGWMTGGEW